MIPAKMKHKPGLTFSFFFLSRSPAVVSEKTCILKGCPAPALQTLRFLTWCFTLELWIINVFTFSTRGPTSFCSPETLCSSPSSLLTCCSAFLFISERDFFILRQSLFISLFLMFLFLSILDRGSDVSAFTISMSFSMQQISWETLLSFLRTLSWRVNSLSIFSSREANFTSMTLKLSDVLTSLLSTWRIWGGSIPLPGPWFCKVFGSNILAKLLTIAVEKLCLLDVVILLVWVWEGSALMISGLRTISVAKAFHPGCSDIQPSLATPAQLIYKLLSCIWLKQRKETPKLFSKKMPFIYSFIYIYISISKWSEWRDPYPKCIRFSDISPRKDQTICTPMAFDSKKATRYMRSH